MAIWAACWGAFLGLLLSIFGHDLNAAEGLIWGAALGAVCGWSLRQALHKEWQVWQQEVVKKQVQGMQPEQKVVTPNTLAASAPVAQAMPQPAHTSVPAPVPAPVSAPTQASAQAAAQASARSPAPRPEAQATTPTRKPPPLKPQPLARAASPTWLQALQNWLADGNAIVRLGFLLLFIGLAFLAKFAADAGLFPPPLRMAALAAFGVVLLALGWHLRLGSRQKSDTDSADSALVARRLAYAYTLQGAGVAVLYLSIFSAYRLYGLLTPNLAFVLLALVCAGAAVLALLQNAAALAFIGFAGGYAAPILLSTGSNAIGSLLSYYLLLNVGVVALAYARAWRGLNLLGFFASFGVLSMWVAGRYQASDYGVVQPFVLAYFALYVLAALFYALRHSLEARQAVDATLVFGVPAASMGLEFKLMQSLPSYTHGAAWAAFAMAAVYTGLAYGLGPRAAAGGQAGVVARWLRQSYAALALVFITVALALGLDAQWTAAMWALEGLAVYWIGSRQGQPFARGMGLYLQALAAWAFINAHIPALDGVALHPRLWGMLVLALSAWGVCALLQKRLASADALKGEGFLEQLVSGVEAIAAPPLFLLACLWWFSAGWLQISYSVPQAGGYHTMLISREYMPHTLLLFFALSAWGLQHWARSNCSARLPIAALPLWLLLPAMLGFAYYDLLELDFFVQKLGWLAWPAALGLYLQALRGQDGSAQGQYKTAWAWQHYGVVALMWLLLSQLLHGVVTLGHLDASDWPAVFSLLAASVVLLILLRPAHFVATVETAASQNTGASWPWQPYGRVYLKAAAGTVAATLFLGTLGLSMSLAGNTPPLPYLPFFNPVDLALLCSLAVLALYRQRWRKYCGAAEGAAYALFLLGFLVFNSIWLRVVHHWWGVAWQADALFDSFVTQAGYSILWTLLALGMMLWASRGGLRRLWLGGAALLGITVVKLFLVDLSNSGGAERIISFIAVGGLMLVLGYFAPLPKNSPKIAVEKGAAQADFSA